MTTSTMWSFLQEHTQAATVVTLLSLLLLAGSVLALPWIVARAPVDFFVRAQRPSAHGRAALRLVVRNLVGALLLVAGVLMLILPGQGLLTIFVGLCLLDFPGKHVIERRIVRRREVRRTLQWLRRRTGRPEFELPPDP